MPKKPPRHNPQNRTPRTVQSAGAVLQRVMQRAGVQLAARPEWLARVREALPEGLRPHLVDVIEKEGELVLFAESAAWAGRLKLLAGEKPEFAGGRNLTIRVLPRGSLRR